jgi:glycosyltransferase involved in cell wall biosynthesis
MLKVAVPLTLLSVAYPFAPVGPDAVGGAEQVLATLDRSLTRAGHRSIVIAQEGSRCQGRLLPIPKPKDLSRDAQAEGHVQVRRAIAQALERYPVDLIHFHGVDFASYLPPDGLPVLATLHLPPHLYPREAFSPRRPGTFLHCVSESQTRACPAGAPLMQAIPNGVDLEALRPGPRKRSYALSLGRICPEKGYHDGIDAARKAGVRLILAGEVFPYENHQRYFQERIRPRLGRGVRFLGPQELGPKQRLLAAARCLLVPSHVPETSSLVSMEALACGTPVVAFRTGALPEVIDHGRTGFLVSSVDEMAGALREVDAIDPAECRREAERRFSSDLMVSRYLDLYRQLAAQLVHV